MNINTNDAVCFMGIFRKCLLVGSSENHQRNNLLLSPEKKESHLEGAGAVEPVTVGEASSIEAPTRSLQQTLLEEQEPAGPSMRLSPSNLQQQLRVLPLHHHHHREQQAWEKLEDDLFLILNGRTDHLERLHNLHTTTTSGGLTASSNLLLRSIAFLASRPGKSDESTYFEHISTVAGYLSIGRAKPEVKLAVVHTLMSCLSPVEVVAWQTQEAVIEGTLDFMTKRSDEWEFMEHSEMILIWEIRAMCLRQLEREQERVARVTKTGDTAAVMIAAGAKLVEAGMAQSVPIISDHLDTAGARVKGWVKTDDYPLMMDRDAVVAMAFSGAAKRASAGVREGTRMAVIGICDASTRGLEMVANKFDDNKRVITENIPPEGLEMLKAAGKVGMATIGAAAIVGEAVIETSRAVVQKTAGVTADVVQHKYGSSAGQVVTDAGEAVGNVLRTVGNVAMLERTVLAKSVAKNAGKLQVDNDMLKARDTMRLLESQAMHVMKQTIGYAGMDKSHRALALQLSRVPTTAIKVPVAAEDKGETKKASTETKVDSLDVTRGEEIPTEPERHGVSSSASNAEYPSNRAVPDESSNAPTSQDIKRSESSSSTTTSKQDIKRRESTSSSITTSSQRASITSTTSQRRKSTSSVASHASVGDVETSSVSSRRSESSNMSTVSQQSVKIGRRGSQTRRKRTPLTPDTAGKQRRSSQRPLGTVTPDRHRSSRHSVEAKRRGNARKNRVPLTPDTTKVGKENHTLTSFASRSLLSPTAVNFMSPVRVQV